MRYRKQEIDEFDSVEKVRDTALEVSLAALERGSDEAKFSVSE